MTRIDRIIKQSYIVTHDPHEDGNCQFAALCYVLRELGIYRSQDTLRVEAVQFIEEHDMIVCYYYHVTYVFQSESTLYGCLNIMELLARNRRDIGS